MSDEEPECSMGYDCDDTTHDGHCGEPRMMVGICPTCKGDGKVELDRWTRHWIRCPDCRGTGRYPSVTDKEET